MNQLEVRIVKLYRKGVPLEDIARRIGYGGNLDAGIARCLEALKKAGMSLDKPKQP